MLTFKVNYLDIEAVKGYFFLFSQMPKGKLVRFNPYSGEVKVMKELPGYGFEGCCLRSAHNGNCLVIVINGFQLGIAYVGDNGEFSCYKETEFLGDLGTVYGLQSFGDDDDIVCALTWDGFLVMYKIFLGSNREVFRLKKLRVVNVVGDTGDKSGCLDVSDDGKHLGLFQIYQKNEYGKFYASSFKLYEIIQENLILKHTFDLKSRSIQRLLCCSFFPDGQDSKIYFIGLSDTGIEKDYASFCYDKTTQKLEFMEEEEGQFNIGLVCRLTLLPDGIYGIDDLNQMIRITIE